MAKFTVEVYRDWREFGEITVEAASKFQARTMVNDVLQASSTEIEWDGITNTERLDDSCGIEKVTQVAAASR